MQERVSLDELYGLQGREAATAASRLARVFYRRVEDLRGVPAETDLGFAVQITPHAGKVLTIYCAVLPSNEPEYPGSELAWCASAVYPPGEIGLIYPLERVEIGHDDEAAFALVPNPEYEVITRAEFLAAAEQGWPEVTPRAE
jgi:hypothetical protein